MGLPRFYRPLKGLVIHPGQHQNLAGLTILRDGGNQSVFIIPGCETIGLVDHAEIISMNRARVSALSLKHPVKCAVTVPAPDLLTPRVDIHW